MLNVRIGHTALTWNYFEEPARLAEAIGDCAELGYAGTETWGGTYDWWERERPGDLRRLLADHGLAMACLFQFGDWIAVLHTFTYANALHQALQRGANPELARGVYHGAISVYLDRFLNIPPARLPAAPRG